MWNIKIHFHRTQRWSFTINGWNAFWFVFIYTLNVNTLLLSSSYNCEKSLLNRFNLLHWHTWFSLFFFVQPTGWMMSGQILSMACSMTGIQKKLFTGLHCHLEALNLGALLIWDLSKISFLYFLNQHSRTVYLVHTLNQLTLITYYLLP